MANHRYMRRAPSARRDAAPSPALACALTLALAACGSSHSTPTDGGRPDGATADSGTGGADAGACTPLDIADWSCVQGDPATHVCTDSMYPPTCTAGRWVCSGSGQPDWLVGCWCHVGPSPWPEHAPLCSCGEIEGWTCDFRCGPDLLCASSSEYCTQTPSDVGGEPDSYSCRPFERCASLTPSCDCVAAGSVSCASVENGGIVAVYPGG